MLAASLDNAIADLMDTIRWSDQLPTRTGSSSGIVRLLGPIWDRANRVTQVCHLERIAPEARSPNWPYGRLDRAPLSVPLETTLGAPRGGAKTACERWQDRSVASEDRYPVADNPPYSKYIMQLRPYDPMRPAPHRVDHPPRGEGPGTVSWPAVPDGVFCPVVRAADPAPALPGGRGPRYTAGAWAEDRATRGRDPSADPGAKTGAGGTMPPLGIPGLAQCDKSTNRPPTAAISPPPPYRRPTRRLLPSGADPSFLRAPLARDGRPGRPAATPATPAE